MYSLIGSYKNVVPYLRCFTFVPLRYYGLYYLRLFDSLIEDYQITFYYFQALIWNKLSGSEAGLQMQ